MNKYLIHADLMANLFRFFNSTCDIQTPTVDGGDYGGSDPTSWTNVTTDIDCVISRISNSSEGNEIRRKDKTIVLHPYGIILDGVFTIDETNRIVSNSLNYDVLSVNYDSKNTYTSLICEIIT